MAKNVRVLIVEDHDMARMGLSVVLGNNDKIEVVGMCADGQDGVDKALDLIPDVVIMDIGLPTIDGIEATKEIKRLNPNIKIVVLTSHSDEKDVLNSLKAGANAYCSKEINLDRLINVVNSVFDGASWFDPSISNIVLKAATNTQQMNDCSNAKLLYNLTSREAQILKLITEGYSNIEIAKKLFVSVNTTKVHVASILQKLEVDDRLQAAVKALKENIV